MDPSIIYVYFDKFQIIDFFIPLLIFTALFYVGLSKVEVLKKNKSNAILAVSLAAIVVMMHVMGRIPRCWDAVAILIAALPKLGFFMIGLLLFIIVLGIVGVADSFFVEWRGWTLLALLIMLVYSFMTSRGPDCPFFLDFQSEAFWALVVMAGILFIGYLVVKKTPRY